MRKNTLLFYFTILFSMLVIMSCSKDNDDYKGKNEIFLSTETATALIDEEGAELKIKILLTRALDKSVTLKFAINNNKVNGIDIVSLVENPVSIEAGKREALLTLRSDNKGLLMNTISISLTLASSSNQELTLNNPLFITVNPGLNMPILTDKQKQLIEGYKAKGIDISKWIGLIPVTVQVTFPGKGLINAFSQPYKRILTGRTLITLSENATQDQPVLKMTNNAMGVEEYLYDIFRLATILDTEFWLNQPGGQQAVKLTGLSASKAEVFKLSLDNLKFNTSNFTIDFISTIKDSYDYDIKALAFQYSYSAWDRMLELIKAGNQNAIDADQTGGSLNPAKYLNLSKIDKDDYEEGNWIAAQALYDNTKGEMKFLFNLDHHNCGDYMKFEVVYTPVK